MEELANNPNFDQNKEKKIFRSVFKLLDDTVDGNVFRPWNKKTKTFRGAFSLAAFEGLALTMGRFWAKIEPVAGSFRTQKVIETLWGTKEYTDSFSGLRASERMVRVMPAAERVVEAEIKRIRGKLTSDE